MSKYGLNKAGTKDLQARIDEVFDSTIDEKKLAGAVTKSKSGGNYQ